MLRNIRVKNFVHFYEEQTLSFNKGGPYFFIGQNESGKSCMFEAVRRCMSTSKNKGMSSCHKPDEYSFVICEFELESDKRVYSGVVQLGKDWSEKSNSDTCIKFVYFDSTLLVDLVAKAPGSWAFNKDIDAELQLGSTEEFGMCLESEKFDFNKFEEIVRKHIIRAPVKLSEHMPSEYNETACENYLLTNIDPALIVTYPVRSIATVQWTKSHRFSRLSREKSREEDKKDLRERSEIVSWYFDEFGSNITDIEKLQTECFFRKITNNSSFSFDLNETKDKIIAYESNESKEKKPLSLEKVPEGFFEALNCSILLAVQCFKTICLEEAGRGMHPQMIERMRDLVLKKITDKVITTTSHIPTFLATWNIPRIYFFRRIRDTTNEDVATFRVVTGQCITEEREKKIPRMLSSHEYHTIFFARRILLVEGDSENYFFTTLKSILLDDEQLSAGLLTDVADKSDLKDLNKETINRFFNSLHMLSLNGHQNKLKMQKVCKILSLEHYFLLDFDAVVKKGSCSKFVKDFELVGELSEEAVLRDIECLEKKGVFVWRNMVRTVEQGSEVATGSSEQEPEYLTDKVTGEGAANTTVHVEGSIEYAVVSLHEETEGYMKSADEKTLKDVCKANNVKLDWDHTHDKSGKHKLFSNQKITETNVRDVVRKVLVCCRRSKNSEMFRLLKFLFQASTGDV